MATTQSQDIQPSSTPQTSAGAGWLTASQRRTLEAVCDALIPAVAAPPGEDDPHGYYARIARELDVARLMEETLGQESPESRAQFAQLLDLLGSSAGGLLVAGSAKGLADLPQATRERA